MAELFRAGFSCKHYCGEREGRVESVISKHTTFKAGFLKKNEHPNAVNDLWAEFFLKCNLK